MTNNDLDDMFTQISKTMGPKIPGGCEQCDAYQVLQREDANVWHLTVHHDDWCPEYLRMTRASDVDDKVDEPAWLFRDAWPAACPGRIEGVKFVGKTWSALDAAVAAASGTPWLNEFPCETPGAVTMFMGRDPMEEVTRRLDAIARSKGHVWTALPISITCTMPEFNDADLDALAVDLRSHQTVLVVIDPSWMVAPDRFPVIAKTCEEAGAALMVAAPVQAELES